MKKGLIIGLVAVAGIAGVGMFAFGMETLSLKWKRYFAPQHENVKREVFEETKSYNEGKIQQLAKYKLEYERANTADRAALASTIQHMFADMNPDRLPPQLGAFLTKIRGY